MNWAQFETWVALSAPPGLTDFIWKIEEAKWNILCQTVTAACYQFNHLFLKDASKGNKAQNAASEYP